MKKKAALIIMDGWGHGKKDSSDAVHLAKTPFIDSLYDKVPHAELVTYGEGVGLPEGQMGNSEVGHLNIGAGRIVYQDLQKINKSIESGEMAQNKELLRAIRLAKEGRKLHLMGLLSDGGVHSSLKHVHGLLDICASHGLKDVFVHAFMDGRDTDPEHGVKYVRDLQAHMQKSTGKLATMIGRYFAMDRDKRWERIYEAYALLTAGVGEKAEDAISALKASYFKDVTDEFLKATVLTEQEEPIALIGEDDVVICFNFRTDRCREISMALTQQEFPAHNMTPLALHYFTMTEYDKTYKNIGVFFTKDNITQTLGETLANAGASQLRSAETEKYPHVTFFFNGGREEPFDKELRFMANSPKVATYDMQPEMSAQELTEGVCKMMSDEHPDFICLNFANPDMVGHTGVQEAVIKAVETTDDSVRKIVELGKDLGYEFIIIADHGNAELNINEDGSAHTSHTINPVPIFYIGERFSNLEGGILADVAPSVLAIMQIAQPSEMTGRCLMS